MTAATVTTRSTPTRSTPRMAGPSLARWTPPSPPPPASAEELVEAARQVCPYSNATRGNVPVTLETTVG